MSQPASLHRYFSIVKKLQAKPYATMDELITHVEKQLDNYRKKDGKAEVGTSQRTLQRDFKAIQHLPGISVQYCRRRKGYHVAESDTTHRFLQQMAQSFEVFQLLHLSNDLQAFIQTENRQAKGTGHFGIILSAIKDSQQLQFTYHKHGDDAATQRTAEPYQLREAGNRWYLVGKNKGYVKNFALDRMSEVEISKVSFTPPANKSYEAMYQFCFGIDGPHNEEAVQEIVLSFDPCQGKYIKNLPLHASQKILVDNDTELRISLRLYSSRDLEMQILSYGEKVKVLQPESLVNSLEAELKTTLKQYKK